MPCGRNVTNSESCQLEHYMDIAIAHQYSAGVQSLPLTEDQLKRRASIVSLVIDAPADVPVYAGSISDDQRMCAAGCDRDVRPAAPQQRTPQFKKLVNEPCCHLVTGLVLVINCCHLVYLVPKASPQWRIFRVDSLPGTSMAKLEGGPLGSWFVPGSHQS